MIRVIGIAMALLAGPALASEPMDCFNDEIDTDSRYTSTQPEALRVTDADIEALLRRIRESEARSVAASEESSSIRLSLADEPAGAD